MWRYGHERRRREMREQMIAQEIAVMHGTASVHNKRHAESRQREWSRVLRGPATYTGKPNIAGWEQLARLTVDAGGVVQSGGERFVN